MQSRFETALRRLAAALGPAGVLFCLLALGGEACAKMGVFDSPHNLSASGGRGRTSGRPGVVYPGEQQVCVFCHVPHNAISGTPLWSHALSPEGTGYLPYNQSSTLNASPLPGRPTGASRLCLSCHDGTIAMAKYTTSPISDAQTIPTDFIPGETAEVNATVNPNLSTNLRDDHPVSFLYTQVLAQKSHLAQPSTLPGEIRLEGGISLECTACHDPHDNEFGNFLVMSNGSEKPGKPGYLTGSPLCVSCHAPDKWKNAAHNNPSIVPLGHGCLSCHSVHSAPGAIRLLKHAAPEDNCIASCHNGVEGTGANMKPLFGTSMHRHPVDRHSGIPGTDHDAKEPLPARNYHVQCVDCHNAHQANASGAPLSSPPLINGRLQGVRKDSLENEATTEYDICYKCHAGGSAGNFSGVTEVMPNRMIPDPDQSERFDLQNPSFHPVAADRRTAGASLLVELRPTMTRIYCSDCHNSDQSAKALGTGTGPNGPHGSQYPHILMARYDMPLLSDLHETYSNSLYSLCFRCHSADYVMTSGSAFSSQGVNEHGVHVRDRQIPCFACHDPHGTPWRRGATAANNAHLINFDRNYTIGSLVANPLYVTTAAGSGSCTVNCHTVVGNTESYGSGVSAAKGLKQKRGASVPLPIKLR
jgi:hypothetical protein